MTSSEHAPWYVVPADDKEMARYIVAKIIWEEMQNTDRNQRWMIR
jgi:polyphosphate kinase 2 (PPK2 family)